MGPAMTITRIAGELHRLEAAAARTPMDTAAWPAGLLSRTCLASRDGLTVVDVWESRLALGDALEAGALRRTWRGAGARSIAIRVLSARMVEIRPVRALAPAAAAA